MDNAVLYNSHNLKEQLGGSNVTSMTNASYYVRDFGYDQININVGCPSPRVANKGCFGASLMRDPELVRDIVRDVGRASGLPVSVKTRIGVDADDSYNFLKTFVETVSSGGCRHFIIHARKAWLMGVNPKRNRSVPPLQYDRVFQLCEDFPDISFTLNGGVKDLVQVRSLLEPRPCRPEVLKGKNDMLFVSPRSQLPVEEFWKEEEAAKLLQTEAMRDSLVANCSDAGKTTSDRLYGVMIGRAAAENPCLLAHADTYIYQEPRNPPTALTRQTVLNAYLDYLESLDSYATTGSKSFTFLKPILGLLHSQQGNRFFRRQLDFLIRKSAEETPAQDILRQCLRLTEDRFPGVWDDPISFTAQPTPPYRSSTKGREPNHTSLCT